MHTRRREEAPIADTVWALSIDRRPSPSFKLRLPLFVSTFPFGRRQRPLFLSRDCNARVRGSVSQSFEQASTQHAYTIFTATSISLPSPFPRSDLCDRSYKSTHFTPLHSSLAISISSLAAVPRVQCPFVNNSRQSVAVYPIQKKLQLLNCVVRTDVAASPHCGCRPLI